MINFEGTKWIYSGVLADDLEGIASVRARNTLQNLGAYLHQAIANKLSQHGSGKFYLGKNGNGRHQASAPGQPPAPDTKDYLNSMYVAVKVFKYRYAMEFRSEFWDLFGRRLELGGTGGGAYIAPRPHIRPVWEAGQEEMNKMIEDT